MRGPDVEVHTLGADHPSQRNGCLVREVGKQTKNILVSDRNVYFIQIKTKQTAQSGKPDKNPTN